MSTSIATHIQGSTRGAGQISRTALPDDVYELLLDELSFGNLEPGSSLSIDGLSRHFGVSPTPIREALARLESTGLVTRQARRGYQVAPRMTTQQMSDLMAVRAILEVEAVRGAMKNSKPLIKQLQADLRAQERARIAYEACTDPDQAPKLMREYAIRDWAFHDTILQHSNNPYLAAAVNGLSYQVQRMRQRVGRSREGVNEHQLILDAISSGDVEAAVSAMRDHLRATDRRIATDPPN